MTNYAPSYLFQFNNGCVKVNIQKRRESFTQKLVLAVNLFYEILFMILLMGTLFMLSILFKYEHFDN
jgi:hypothetical protein